MLDFGHWALCCCRGLEGWAAVMITSYLPRLLFAERVADTSPAVHPSAVTSGSTLGSSLIRVTFVPSPATAVATWNGMLNVTTVQWSQNNLQHPTAIIILPLLQSKLNTWLSVQASDITFSMNNWDMFWWFYITLLIYFVFTLVSAPYETMVITLCYLIFCPKLM